ncbi:hypothetical protein ACSBLW_03380 [Thioclava sp. FR2]|uniref:hypothetical protein n=1 Tax=Thioclava sp. FR2 TaxID=3445780 RepID=UPI003EBA5574
MSNPESFIDEVTEEVRRDRLFATFRKYGWIGVLLVVAVVGGSAYNEWSKARAEASAEAFGDALIDALDLGAPEDRRAALASIPAEDGQKAILNLVLATDPAENREESLKALAALEADSSQPQAYRDLATLRRVIVSGKDLSIQERRAALEPIAVAGRPFRPLALEQLAYLLLEEGKTDEAIAAMTALTQDQQSPSSLRGRVDQMITVLGGKPASVATGNGG